MPNTTDFQAFAIGSGALVLTPSQLVQQVWLTNGFTGGTAQPQYLNTLWRQSSFVCAAITQWMANHVNVNISDNGDMTLFINQFTTALGTVLTAPVTSFNGRTGAVTLTSVDVTTALGYTPLASLNKRTGIVTLQSADVTSALTYTPINKGGDTMKNPLSGPTPTAAANYATKSYVDTTHGAVVYSAADGLQIQNNTVEFIEIPNATVLGNDSGATTWPYPLPANILANMVSSINSIHGSPTAYDFPLGNGAFIKCGFYTEAQIFNPPPPSPALNLGFAPGVGQVTFNTPFATGMFNAQATLYFPGYNSSEGWNWWGNFASTVVFNGQNIPIQACFTNNSGQVCGFTLPAIISTSPGPGVKSGFTWLGPNSGVFWLAIGF